MLFNEFRKRYLKQHHFYSDCVHDLSNVFRWDDNIGKNTREKPTPDSSTLLRNLDRFSEKWQDISNTQVHSGDPFL